MAPEPGLSVIEGSKNQRTYLRLLNAPQSFDDDEFDRLLELFRDRISRAEAYDLIVERLRRTPCNSEIEKQVVIAAATGDTATLKRLTAILERRNALGLKVISSELHVQATPPRSS